MKPPSIDPQRQINTTLFLLVGFLFGLVCAGLLFFVYRGASVIGSPTHPRMQTENVPPTDTPLADAQTNSSPQQIAASSFQQRLKAIVARANAPTGPAEQARVVANAEVNNVPTHSAVLAKIFPASVVQTTTLPVITGKVTFKGTPPPEKPILFDPTCGELHATTVTTRIYQVSPDGGLADVLVYVKEGLGPQQFEPPASPALLDQVGCLFNPYVLGLQVGQKLLVRNSDPVLHNVHVIPALNSGNKESNRAQLPHSKDFGYVFENPEIFLRFKCNVHSWMFAYVGVVKHPFFAVTDTNGHFTLPGNLTPGNYVIEAVHRKSGAISKTISLLDKSSRRIDFSFDVNPQ